MAAEVIIAIIHAGMTAVDMWVREQDRKRAVREADGAYSEIVRSPRLKRDAQLLESVVPPEVLEAMATRVKNCWKSYMDVLKDEDDYLPKEVDAATTAVQKCICRELRRIHQLNGEIPPGPMREWWNRYCLPHATG
jgi:hypothetical protein